jgi:hypothetical protein
MCYSQEMSGLFTIMGTMASIITYKKQQHTGRYFWVLVLFYTIMELLQTVQYSYINLCGNYYNYIFTEVAYVLVLVQPLMWNTFFYINDRVNRQRFSLAIAMCMVWIVVNIAARLTYTTTNALDPRHSVYAAGQVCTRARGSHLFWEWTVADFKDLSANMFTYLLVWFVPGLFSSKYLKPHLVVIFSACIGALMALYAGQPKIFTSAWCYVSVPMMIGVYMAI